MFFRVFSFVSLALVSLSPSAAPPVSEKIVFLNQDGRSAYYYDTLRSDAPTYDLLFEKDDVHPLEEHLSNYLYIYPNEYSWEQQAKPNYDTLRFQQGSFAFLHKTSLDRYITVDAAQIHTYSNESEAAGGKDRYGFWNTPDDFHHFTYTWIFPANFEIVDYRCNRPGEWVIRGNTLSYFGKQVNNLTFRIRYRFASHATYEAVSQSVKSNEDVEISQDVSGVKVVLNAMVLFSSGSANVSVKGRKILADLARSLLNEESAIIVEGHTDNVPIQSSLKQTFPSNWELSAARATSVIHILAGAGIAETRLEAHAFASTRPVASNDTAQGRGRNRRIEILIRR